MKLIFKENVKKPYSKPVIYKIDPDDHRMPHIKELFEQLKKDKKIITGDSQPRKLSTA